MGERQAKFTSISFVRKHLLGSCPGNATTAGKNIGAVDTTPFCLKKGFWKKESGKEGNSGGK